MLPGIVTSITSAGPHYSGEVHLNLIFSGVMVFGWLSIFTFCLARRSHGQWASLGITAGLLGVAGFGVPFAARAEVILADDNGLARKLAEGHTLTILNGCAAGAVLLIVLALVASHLDTVRMYDPAYSLVDMTTSRAELLAAVPSLNDPAQPFSYAVEGDKIVGSWDIVKATTLYPTEIEHVDKSYRIEVTVDEEKSTFDFDEHSSETGVHVDGGGLSFEKGGFSGKSSSKEFSLSFGGVKKTVDGVSVDPLVYSFSTAKIKDPLFGFLEQHGYHRKHGLLGRLFNH